MRSVFVLPLLAACKPDEPPTFGSSHQDPVIEGRLCSPSGYGSVGSALVYIPYDKDGDGTAEQTFEATTDAGGHFEFADMPSGDWVVHAVKGQFTLERAVDDYEEGTYRDLGTLCFDPGDVKIAVVTGTYDSIETLLELLGFEPDVYEGEALDGPHLELLTTKGLQDYDIVFLNCGMHSDMGSMPRALPEENAAALQAFVQAGGSVYSSDWALTQSNQVFPGSIELEGLTGMADNVTGHVEDPALQALVGDDVELNYNYSAWAVMSGVGQDVRVLVSGDAPVAGGGLLTDVPLAAVRQEPDLGKDVLGGRVLYTTFHNEAQITSDMEAILLDFIMSL